MEPLLNARYGAESEGGGWGGGGGLGLRTPPRRSLPLKPLNELARGCFGGS